MSFFDANYRLLFSHRALLRDLLQVVAPAGVLERLSIGTAELMSPVYVGPALQIRQADMVWRIPVHASPSRQVLIAIELQSSPDAYMALRT